MGSTFTLNRTTLELKHLCPDINVVVCTALNRTILELKHMNRNPRHEAGYSLNRTILELKPACQCMTTPLH